MYLLMKTNRKGQLTTFDLADDIRQAEAKAKYERAFMGCYVAIVETDSI